MTEVVQPRLEWDLECDVCQLEVTLQAHASSQPLLLCVHCDRILRVVERREP